MLNYATDSKTAVRRQETTKRKLPPIRQKKSGQKRAGKTALIRKRHKTDYTLIPRFLSVISPPEYAQADIEIPQPPLNRETEYTIMRFPPADWYGIP